MASRGQGRGGRGGRGGGRGAPRGMSNPPSAGPPAGVAGHIETIGVRRPGFGTAGRPLPIIVNSFPTTIPDGIICHYDVVIGSDKKLPARMNMELIRRLQENVAPKIFTPRAVYDGRANLFASHELRFPGGSQTHQFDVTLNDPEPGAKGKGPTVYKIKLTRVAAINTEILARYVRGQQSHDNTVLTALTALNVVIRMEPNQRYPFNVRSFFTKDEKKDIGGGIVLWRGYFQSVRPAINRLLINVDISTATMYKPGALIELCREFLECDISGLLPRISDTRNRMKLQRFITGVRVQVRSQTRGPRQPRSIKKLTDAGANKISFTVRETGKSLTVNDYFRQTYNKPLQFPNFPCVEVGNGALIPIELCDVIEGQFMRKQVPPEKTKAVLDFATKKPQERLNSIQNGLGVLNYGQSEYVRQFGMHVDVEHGPVRPTARVLPPPTLKYGPGSAKPIATLRDGAWNMIDKKFYKPATINTFVVVVYEPQGRFRPDAVQAVVAAFVKQCIDTGINIVKREPLISWENGQGRIHDQLRNLGMQCREKHGTTPNLILVILPEGASDIYTAVKHFGDVAVGVATQCMKSMKCRSAKAQYFANICLKVNPKLGGINLIPDPQSVSILTDPRNPTMVLGADVIHPAPGSDGRPSFTALVGNVDSDTAKYIADIRVQTSREEMIEDLYEMSKYILKMYMVYGEKVEKKPAKSGPKRIIFYRDGVSEGQFKHVLERELPELRRACKDMGINPTITFIIVGKRHHIRLFPQNPGQADRSGNCPAGTVLDTDIVHPVEFDFFLQSHAGLLGTSRSAHYSVLHDDNKFSADGLQSLSFALCHVYARATRSVSIPAPVYYADIVCSRAKNHYDPATFGGGHEFSDSAMQLNSAQAISELERFKLGFKPLHQNTASVMYFS